MLVLGDHGAHFPWVCGCHPEAGVGWRAEPGPASAPSRARLAPDPPRALWPRGSMPMTLTAGQLQGHALRMLSSQQPRGLSGSSAPFHRRGNGDADRRGTLGQALGWPHRLWPETGVPARSPQGTSASRLQGRGPLSEPLLWPARPGTRRISRLSALPLPGVGPRPQAPEQCGGEPRAEFSVEKSVRETGAPAWLLRAHAGHLSGLLGAGRVPRGLFPLRGESPCGRPRESVAAALTQTAAVVGAPLPSASCAASPYFPACVASPRTATWVP